MTAGWLALVVNFRQDLFVFAPEFPDSLDGQLLAARPFLGSHPLGALVPSGGFGAAGSFEPGEISATSPSFGDAYGR